MGKLTLILGGARSGKSDYGERLAQELADDVLFIATAQAFDDDMRDRITRHRAQRPGHWRTVEAPTGVGAVANGDEAVVVVDCMTLLVSNVLLSHENLDEDAIGGDVSAEIDAILTKVANEDRHWIVISNEVGLGIVPDNRMARVYRDVLGRANQRLAKAG